MYIMLTPLQVEKLRSRPELVLQGLKREFDLLLEGLVRAEAGRISESAPVGPTPRAPTKTRHGEGDFRQWVDETSSHYGRVKFDKPAEKGLAFSAHVVTDT
ncbi:hypothetical protein PHMEG_0002759 [Phytophthora megakarya]|uniref:Uncharacterized protein n=1 Tax=Phytophthora megakarya TaxID=4795 RepID=A0A225WY87_9STRA|nr:hypothetical protein PHMEG_0002759 [Phytophthora megakarya]